MTNEELNKAVYDKMSEKRDEYRDWLMTLSPEKVLKNAYEYAIYEDILLSLEDNELEDDQALALLSMEDPLRQAFNRFDKLGTDHMEYIWNALEYVADNEISRKKLKETPLYLFSGSYARQHGETEERRASRNANIACRDAVDAAIQEYFQDVHVDAAAVRKVVGDFGYERLFHVLAVTVRRHSGDERFSGENRRWAMTIPVPENPDGVPALRSHPVKADAFIRTAREEYSLSADIAEQTADAGNGKDKAMEYERAEIFGIPALFANERIDAADLPDGLYRYDLRGSDDDPGRPVAVENHVAVNHAGTLLTAEPLDIPKDGFLPLTEENGPDFLGKACTIQEFLREQKKEHETKQGRNAGKSGRKRASRER